MEENDHPSSQALIPSFNEVSLRGVSALSYDEPNPKGTEPQILINNPLTSAP